MFKIKELSFIRQPLLNETLAYEKKLNHFVL